MQIFGILNLTTDSFFEPKKYLNPTTALKKAKYFVKHNAHALDIGAVSSNPNAKRVPSILEIKRIENLLNDLKQKKIIDKIKISIDCYSSQSQKTILSKKWPFKIDYLNDINGFNKKSVYASLKDNNCKIIIMHSVQREGPADIRRTNSSNILSKIYKFFDTRLAALKKAGLGESRFIIDPGMGFFLGSDPDCSLKVINAIPELKKKFNLPVMISVSRKSFIRQIAGCSIKESWAPSIITELYSSSLGADFIRTHDIKNLSLANKMWQALHSKKYSW